MNTIVDHKSLINALGGNKAVSDHLRTKSDPCPPVRVGQWKLSNSIGPEYWPDLIVMAASKGLVGINSDWFMRAAPRRKRVSVAESEAA